MTERWDDGLDYVDGEWYDVSDQEESIEDRIKGNMDALAEQVKETGLPSIAPFPWQRTEPPHYSMLEDEPPPEE